MEVIVETKAKGGGGSIRAGQGAATRKFKKQYRFNTASSHGYVGYDKAKDVYKYKFIIEG